MFRPTMLVIFASASGLATLLTGCADNRLNGGYTGEPRNLTRLSPPEDQAAPSQRQPAAINSAEFVYRGGRDPVTGKASLSY